jgi:hypothetical protein
MSHTPGPWTVQDCNVDDLQRPNRLMGPVVVYADDDCELHPIADCSCNHTCREIDEAEANARLIAAAPELLEAARQCLKAMEVVERDYGWPYNAPLLSAMQGAEAAIAKAEGK